MKNKINLLITALFIFSGFSLAATTDIAVYTDDGTGTWEDGIVAFENFLDWKGLSHRRITALDVNSTALKDYYQAIYFPGGYAYYYKREINTEGLHHIRDLVASGGGYIGICAGAYFASDSVYWEEDGLIDYPLDLFDGVAAGALDDIAPWDGYTMTTLTMNPADSINQYEPASEDMLYYGGPVFRPHAAFNMETTATWNAYADSAAIIHFNYGQGRVLLIGPHPEIEEDSDRDSSTFADELDDNGSDWPFLWSAVDWLLGRPVSYPSASFLPNAVPHTVRTTFRLEKPYPNPFNNTTRFVFYLPQKGILKMEIINSRGRLVFYTQKQYDAGIQPLNWRGINRQEISLASGVYFVRFEFLGRVQTAKCILLK